MSSILVIFLSLVIFIICNRPCSGHLENEQQIQNSSTINLSIQGQDEDFQPYTGNKSHPIYSPILAAHLDDDPNEELNSLHGRKEEDPLLEETEEDASSDSTRVPLHITGQSSEGRGSPAQTEQVSDQQYTPSPEEKTNSSVDDEFFEELSNALPKQDEIPSLNVPNDESSDERSADIAGETEQTATQTTIHPEIQTIEQSDKSSNPSAQASSEEPPKESIQQSSEPPIEYPNERQPELLVAQPTETPTHPQMEQAKEETISTTSSPKQPLELPSKDLPEMNSQQLRANLTGSDELPILAEHMEEKSDHDIAYDSRPSQGDDNLSSPDFPSQQPEVKEWFMHFQMDSTILIYTLFCIACVSILNLGKWLFVSSPNAESSPAQAARRSLENLKDLKSLQNLQNQADKLRLFNRRLVEQIELQKRLEPVKNEIASLRERLGSDVNTTIGNRKAHLKNLQKLLQLKHERNELELKIQRFKHGQLVMILNFIELDNLMDLLKDIEFQNLCNNLRESIFRKQVEIEFLDEQVSLLKKIAKQFQTQYKEFSDELQEERKREKIFDDESAELRQLQKELDEGDSIDTWKSRVDEKITEVDKLYLDYYYNYRYINELLQVA